MKLSTYITILQQIYNDHGDLDMYINSMSHCFELGEPKLKEKFDTGPDGKPLKAVLVNP